MQAMVLEAPGQPLVRRDLPVPNPGPGQVLVRIAACAVCRTDLHVVDGELPEPKLPLIPGHEIVGRIERVGEDVTRFKPGDRVGIPWLGWTCRQCAFCISDRENLCGKYQGRDIGTSDMCHIEYPRGYVHFYQKHVEQAHLGADMDFLKGGSGSEVTRDSH